MYKAVNINFFDSWASLGVLDAEGGKVGEATQVKYDESRLK